jgi:lysylphosphatidylglycerol synthetase-like protein (DUF2156 family)
MYYCVIAIIVLIGLLFYVNIKHSDELDNFGDAFGIYALCVLVSVAWPIALTVLIVVAVVYFLNLCVKKIIDVLNLK